MLDRLIIFLLRKKFGLKKYQRFQFTNQKSRNDIYYFSKSRLMKMEGCKLRESGVRLNWLLHKECRIEKLPEEV